MGNGIDLVELNGDHLGKDVLVRVVDHAASLNNIDCGVGDEALGGPARVVRVREMIAVKDGGDVCASIESEKEVEVVGL